MRMDLAVAGTFLIIRSVTCACLQNAGSTSSASCFTACTSRHQEIAACAAAVPDLPELFTSDAACTYIHALAACFPLQAPRLSLPLSVVFAPALSIMNSHVR